MQAHARGPLRVTREAVDADERQTGFQSRGKIMVEHIVRVIVPSQGVIQPDRRSALWRTVKRPSARRGAIMMLCVRRLYRFLAVALGEEISCIPCEVPSGEPENGILMDSKGCAFP